jgi:ferredoxin
LNYTAEARNSNYTAEKQKQRPHWRMVYCAGVSQLKCTGCGIYWESRPNQHLVDPNDWRPLHNTQLYAISPSYDFTWSF